MDKRLIWTIILLTGGYIFAQLVADVAATRLIQVGPFAVPAGTMIFAVTFTLRDVIHKRLGKEWAQAAIWLAAAFNLGMALYLWAMANLPAPDFYPFTEAWSAIFSFVPAIVLASIAAELVAELIDTEVYHWWRSRYAHRPQWTRVLASNVVSLPVDSVLFATLAFVILPPLFGSQGLALAALPPIIAGQIVLKGLVTVASL
ncbi:MAG: queuosine precursor transporter, partial [Leptolyngbya sp.]|nr:queuosine precursor transporter [Leptolyngbya sp.]